MIVSKQVQHHESMKEVYTHCPGSTKEGNINHTRNSEKDSYQR